MTSVTEDQSAVTTYSYDAASRLTGESNPWTGNVSYAYDGSGNRLSKEKQGEAPVTYSYNQGNQLTSDSSGKTYSYNQRGDLTSEATDSATRTYTWDGKGRLVQVSEDENPTQTFFYDPADRLFGSMKAEQGTLYAYDMDSDIELATFNQDFNPTSLFQTGADGLVSSTSGEDTSYFSYNPHGDASLLTDEEGNTTTQLHYDAWGNAAEETTEPFAWLGKHQRRTMPDLGLIKMGARFYDPETGRFISRDPVEGHDEVPISRNRYVYAYDDPVNTMDLAGRCAYSQELRDCARKIQYEGNDCEQQGQHEQAQDNWNNARRLMEPANEHDKICVEKTQKPQNETNPVKCAHKPFPPEHLDKNSSRIVAQIKYPSSATWTLSGGEGFQLYIITALGTSTPVVTFSVSASIDIYREISSVVAGSALAKFRGSIVVDVPANTIKVSSVDAWTVTLGPEVKYRVNWMCALDTLSVTFSSGRSIELIPVPGSDTSIGPNSIVRRFEIVRTIFDTETPEYGFYSLQMSIGRRGSDLGYPSTSGYLE